MKHLAAILLLALLALAVFTGCSKDDPSEPTPSTPAAPTDLTATQITFSAIVLHWTDNSANEDSFVVRRTDDTTLQVWPVHLTVKADSSTATDSTFLPSRHYYYRISAANAAGSSDLSNRAALVTWDEMLPPTDLQVSQIHPSRVSLSWSDRSAGETGFMVERAESLTVAQWTIAATVGSNQTAAEDSIIAPETLYFYRVRPFNSRGAGSPSAVDSITTLPGIPAPTDFTVGQTNRAFVRLSWTCPEDVDSIRVEQSSDSADWSSLTTLGGSPTAFSDSAITANNKVYFRVRGYDSHFAGIYSTPVSIWTWPAAFDFSVASQLDQFTATGLENTPTPGWELDANTVSAKATLNHPNTGGGLISVLSNYTMQNSGWFESRFMVPNWYSSGNTANYAAFFIERSPSDSNNVLGVFFQQDSTILGYYSTTDDPDGYLIRISTNPHLPIAAPHAWHRVQFFHQAYHWELWIDGTMCWSSNNLAPINNSTPLYQEWQFGQGTGPNMQPFYVDDIANNHADPLSATGSGSGGHGITGTRIHRLK